MGGLSLAGMLVVGAGSWPGWLPGPGLLAAGLLVVGEGVGSQGS